MVLFLFLLLPAPNRAERSPDPLTQQTAGQHEGCLVTVCGLDAGWNQDQVLVTLTSGSDRKWFDGVIRVRFIPGARGCSGSEAPMSVLLSEQIYGSAPAALPVYCVWQLVCICAAGDLMLFSSSLAPPINSANCEDERQRGGRVVRPPPFVLGVSGPDWPVTASCLGLGQEAQNALREPPGAPARAGQ